jgi:hypothetical protein
MGDSMEDAWLCMRDLVYRKAYSTLWREQFSGMLTMLASGEICPGFEGVMARGILQDASSKISEALESVGLTSAKAKDLTSELMSEMDTTVGSLLLMTQTVSVLWEGTKRYRGIASLCVCDVSTVHFSRSRATQRLK